MALIDQLTDAEIVALLCCISGWGHRSWRSKLRLVWEGERPYPVAWTQGEPQALQGLRNRMGPSILLRLKSDAILNAYRQLCANRALGQEVVHG